MLNIFSKSEMPSESVIHVKRIGNKNAHDDVIVDDH